MREIQVIDARTGTIAEKLRVAAYCRVSSDSDDQLNSFLVQVRHYTAYIGQNPEWKLADIYADEGLTGTRMDKRDEFNRLMADCRKGQIDLILVKSTSRFARNTMEFLEALRELRQLGVTVWFENENMRTDKLANETMLALSGVKAQQESISISQNQRWSCQKRMQNGTFLPSSAPYGYRIIGGKFVIVEEEARIVRLIFDWYLSGMGKKAITDRLNATQAIKLNGFDKWYIHSVSYILCNDRYVGNALLQKKYTTDTLPFQQRRNRGERAQYYVEDTNPAILSPGVFEQAKRLWKLREKPAAPEQTCTFTRKIICGRCGRYFRRRDIRGKRYWDCRGHNASAIECPSPLLLESDIEEAFIRLSDKLWRYRHSLLEETVKLLETMQHSNQPIRVGELNQRIAELRGQERLLTQLKSKGYIDAAEYTAQCRDIHQQESELVLTRRRLLDDGEEGSRLAELRELNEWYMTLDGPVVEFNRELFADTVKEIHAEAPNSCRFVLLGGLELREQLPERKRGIAV